MNLLSFRSMIAIGAVVDVALNSRFAPVSGRALAVRLHLPARGLETLLIGLVRGQIVKGVRGPRGGYQLARERRCITVGEIVRAAISLSTAEPDGMTAHSRLLKAVIEPSVNKAAEPFLANLDAVTVEDLCESAARECVLTTQKMRA